MHQELVFKVLLEMHSLHFIFYTLQVPMTRLLCLFILVVLPILGGLSRYAEGFNHLADVIVGIAVGFASSAFIVLSPLR